MKDSSRTWRDGGSQALCDLGQVPAPPSASVSLAITQGSLLLHPQVLLNGAELSSAWEMARLFALSSQEFRVLTLEDARLIRVLAQSQNMQAWS